LTLFEFEVDHADALFSLTDFLLSILENVLLNVALFIEDTKLIVSVNELDTHIVTTLTSMLIVKD